MIRAVSGRDGDAVLRAASDGCMVTGVHAEDQLREQTGTHGTAASEQPWHTEAAKTGFF